MHDVNACETGLRPHCESVTYIFVKFHVHLLLYRMHHALRHSCLAILSPHFVKFACAALSLKKYIWLYVCRLKLTLPLLCDTVALFIATLSPCLLRHSRIVYRVDCYTVACLLKVKVNLSLYCDNCCLVFTWSPHWNLQLDRLVYSKCSVNPSLYQVSPYSITTQLCYRHVTYTVKLVYNDHLMGYFFAFWSSSRWPRAT